MNADPWQLSTNLVASSVYLPSGHASNNSDTFWEYTWRSSFAGSNVGTRAAIWLGTIPWPAVDEPRPSPSAMLPVSEKDPWKSALSAAELRYQCEWPHKGSFAPTTNLKRHSCAFPQALKLHDDSQKVLEGCNSLRFPWGGLASNTSSLSFGSSYGWSNKFPPSAPQLWALSHVAMKTHQSLYRTLQGRTEEAGFTKGSSCNNRAIHNIYIFLDHHCLYQTSKNMHPYTYIYINIYMGGSLKWGSPKAWGSPEAWVSDKSTKNILN